MSPLSHFDVAAAEAGHVKVRLYFNTWEPKHLRSHYLRTEASAEPPFLEDVSVLIPTHQAFDHLSAYNAVFEALRAAGVVAPQDVLKAFEINVEDNHTLAYRELETPCSS
jgi:glyoxylase-like metal-dependent hydrolase (beta-lactamase superfamily II)